MNFPVLRFIVLLSVSFTTYAEQITGKVSRVLDGDTIEILENMHPVRIRLQNIDAPEKKQPFGNGSTQQLKLMVAGEIVTVTYTQKDRYGRILGRVSTAKYDVNRSMVATGAAWVYSQYNADPELPALQRTAQRQKYGIWADPNAIPPWEWRALQRRN